MGRISKAKKAGVKPYDPEVNTEEDFYTHEEMMSLALGDETHAQYRSALKIHSELGFEPNYEGFLKRLSWKREKVLTAASAKLLRNAIVWKLGCQGVILSNAQAHTMTSYIKACSKTHEADTVEPPPGTIDHGMLPEFFEAIRVLPNYKVCEYSDVVRKNARQDLLYAFLTGLRSEQMVSLRRNHFTIQPNGEIQLVIEKIHDPTASLRGTVKMLTIVVPECPTYTQVLLRRLRSLDENPTALVCHGWSYPDRYNSLIKRVAQVLKWPDTYGVSFPGAHCLRRGGIRYVESLKGFEASVAFAGHSMPPAHAPTTVTYLRTNDDRASRVRTWAVKKAKSDRCAKKEFAKKTNKKQETKSASGKVPKTKKVRK